MGSPANVAGQRRFGITPRTEQLGISIVALRKLARPYRRQHALAQELWASGIHEARLLAAYVDDAEAVTTQQMERWACDFDSWDLCDQVCGNLFDRTPFFLDKAREWIARDEEFVKRAGFVLMATSAVHRQDLDDAVFLALLPLLAQGATNERNFVKKAVNWALRQIGKRSPKLRRAAIAQAKEIQALGTRSARWIASDALRELTGRK